MMDRIVRGLLGDVRGNVPHFIAWREERLPEIREDPQVEADLSLLYHLEDFHGHA